MDLNHRPLNLCLNIQEYNTDFLSGVYAEEGTGVFTVRRNVLGHAQVGFDKLDPF